MHDQSTRECLCGCGQRIPKDPHARRLVTGHVWTRRMPLFERFWRWVDYGGPGCWLWTGYVKDTGYGSFTPVHSHPMNAHRALWIMIHGDPGPGIMIRHRCDNRLCVRPSHLEPGTHLQNVRDYWARTGRTDFSGTQRGERHPNAKLSADDVRAIRAAPPLQWGDARLLSQGYGVSTSTIWLIRARKAWRHVL